MSKKPRFPPNSRKIAVLLFEDFQLLDAAGPIAAFEIASHFAPKAYAVRVVAAASGIVRSSSGVRWPADALGAQRGVDTLMVAGGYGTYAAMQDRALIAALARAPARARRISSVCSGAFLLAQAGLLKGKRATTHWRRAAQFQKLFPDVRLEPDCIHVRDGKMWTSAGVSAGIDLALAMITEDLGADIANEVAREMVVYAQRPGGQAQHSALLDLGGGRFDELNTWMRAHIGDDLRVETLAAQAAMSPRNFARAYAAETGLTPAKAVERLRAEAARTALTEGAALQSIATRCGFGDVERMRRAFIRLYGAPPAALRRTLRHA
ncbi:MAG: DJ-1/PfpI family protein [Hyphomonadaceae bacterium]|nr:DJ-1/PfpI family protein [Hyphomonadaceae bacterium]